MQSKFVKQDTKLLALIEKCIKSEIKRRNSLFNHEVILTGHLTECSRRIMYRVNATKPDREKDFFEDYRKKYIKRKWIEFFSSSLNVVVVEENISASDCNYNVLGVADAILKIGEIVCVLLIEPLGFEEYIQAKSTSGLRKHIVDIMMLMWLTGVDNGILLCENQNNEYFMSHVVPFEEIVKSATSKCSELMQQKILQEMPERAYTDVKNKECQVCEYRKTCWEKGEINGK